jgi:hypothetical protein
MSNIEIIVSALRWGEAPAEPAKAFAAPRERRPTLMQDSIWFGGSVAPRSDFEIRISDFQTPSRYTIEN